MAMLQGALVVLFFLAAACKASRLPGAGSGVAAGAAGTTDDRLLFQQSVADEINRLSPGWTAGFDKSQEARTLKSFQKLLGSKPRPAGEADTLLTRRRHRKHATPIPVNFDSREQWPHCRTLFEIRDQGHCGSCWAFGAVEVLSDRFCTLGHENVSLSTNDLVACCGFQCGEGCNGGYPYKAWKYFVRKGVVSEQCQPYFDQVGCKHPGCEPVYPTPRCSRHCSGDDELWGSSKHYAESAYYVAPAVEDIQAEVLERGPVEVAFTVYEDFAYYKSGVYKHVYGDEAGGHAVKLIGWGTTEDGIDYWLIANSWNKSWGEDGYFRIVRGVDECGIESEVVAGMPLLKGRHIAAVSEGGASAEA